ncbi:potassium transporter peripheral membrane protein [Sulfurifustis variabilis]|uniref:Trk system potassium uptake protein TrkA n=1 Tax=Sulfurifustis variabilis TaxID=1675686 RepID=A0A1B4UZN3_9GAMM|nr:Trk system potassium transporter TrkA [Sulfurifustis variabilis]BAU46598.1 potassium transporter peripheral membrane protein [Sulfurifustis variabilis]
MKVIILGAGQVGSSVAENLVRENYDITVVDTNGERLQDLQDRFDLRTVTGGAAFPAVLEQAGAEDADMILAVTNSDEVNMVACKVAYALFHTPTKIARIRAADYLSHPELFSQETVPIDVIISPEQIVTDYILRLIEYPAALQVLDFAGGLVRLAAVRAVQGGPLVGQQLRELRKHLPKIDTRVAAIYRRDRPIIPTGDTVIEVDDEVFFIAAARDIRSVLSELRRAVKPVKRVLIAGGGNIGRRLARALERRGYVPKIIERDPARARLLSEELNQSVVLLGDAADGELLVREGIEDIDTFCALTNDDEANILSALLAKRLGAYRVMSLINRAAYVDLVQGGGNIDIAISPQQATIGSLLTHLRRGDVVAVHSLRRGAAEAIEAVAHGDPSNSRVVGRAIENIPLPHGTTIGAIVRDSEVLMAHHDTVIQPNDHVILFIVDKKQLPEVERLFQVAFTFV